MKVGTASSELRAAFAGGLVLLGASGVVALERPRPGVSPVAAPEAKAVVSAAPRAARTRLGPLVLGSELALGFRIVRVADEGDSIRVELASGARRIALGVSSKEKRLERPPALPFPNLNVWYVGRGETPAEYAELARALVKLLEQSAGDASVSDLLERWKAGARDGG